MIYAIKNEKLLITNKLSVFGIMLFSKIPISVAKLAVNNINNITQLTVHFCFILNSLSGFNAIDTDTVPALCNQLKKLLKGLTLTQKTKHKSKGESLGQSISLN